MFSQFSEATINALKYYVYALVDPIDKRIFYVGKGCGNRVFQHAADAVKDTDGSLKLDTIRRIHHSGNHVGYYIIRHGLTEEEAFLVESSIIDLLTYPAFNRENLLTNLVAGHHQWDEGIKSVEELSCLYDSPKLVVGEGYRLLLVNLNRTYRQAQAEGVYVRPNIYECARKYWYLDKNRADKADYVLGVYRGVVRVVIKPTSAWIPVNVAEDGTVFKKTRYMIEGDTDDLLGNNLYLHRDVRDFPFGSRGVVRYIP